MNITGTHIAYYIVCKRKLWLFLNGITMEHTSDTVYDGKLLHETSYPDRAQKHTEITLSATFNQTDLYGKIDFYDTFHKVIHETKRGNKVETAHHWQAKFYLWLLYLNGIEGAYAILEYPLLRQTERVDLHADDILHLEKATEEISKLKEQKDCPPVINAKICKSCSYYELCYISEA